MAKEIDLDVAKRVLSVVDEGLSIGLGIPAPGQMCVEAAVNYALGNPHGDSPTCVASALRAFKITLNDTEHWGERADRARGLRRLALAQLGSYDHFDAERFNEGIEKFAIEAIYSAAKILVKEKTALMKEYVGLNGERELRELLREAPDLNGVGALRSLLARIKYASYQFEALFNACHSLLSEIEPGVRTMYLASVATYAAQAIGHGKEHAAEKTALLTDFAEGAVQVLIKMEVPGTQWLFLTEPAQPNDPTFDEARGL